jgi:hypothetical protein
LVQRAAPLLDIYERNNEAYVGNHPPGGSPPR